MPHFNWADLLIALALACACYYGTKVGFLRLLFLFGGFFGGLFLAGWLLPHLLPIHNQTVKTIINANLVICTGLIIALKGYDLAERYHFSLKRKGRIGVVESFTGASLSLASALVLVWLASAAIITMPLVSFSNSFGDALIVQELDNLFPSVPAVFAGLGRAVDPNAPPEVFVKQQPNSFAGQTKLPAANPAVVTAGKSVVRITGFGCGGIISGSGFVIGPGLVATAAHVVAGVHRPIIKTGNKSLEAVPVLFNQNLDFAVLRSDKLSLKPLSASLSDSADGTGAYIIGYPGGNFAVTPGVVLDKLTLEGANIYGLPGVERDVYEIKAKVNKGGSGGPLVLASGQVVGLFFGYPRDNNKVAYALNFSSLTDLVNQAGESTHRVNTGPCAI